MSTITWLHLSDLHFKEGEQSRWDENIVLKALLKDLKARMDEDGLRPDFIVVTGDIAFSGEPAEYALAGAFLGELRGVTGVPGERVFVVPGNHDISRRAISPGARAIAGSLDNRAAVSELLTTEEDRRLVFRRLRNYRDFLGSSLGHLPAGDEHFSYTRQLEIAGRTLAVLGLNSAWLAYGGDDDRGQLALGERQVRPALEAARAADLVIGMMHHPFDWLRDFDRDDCEALLMDGCDFMLHGHLHRGGLLSLQTPDAAAMLIAGGACYETRQYPNSYNLVRLDLERREGTVYLRTYSDRQGGFWTGDSLTYKNVPDGEFSFLLPKAQSTARSRKKSGAPEASPGHVSDAEQRRLEMSYLRRVQEDANPLPLAIIDPRAVERSRLQTMELLRVYVALNTETRVPVEEDVRPAKGRRAERGMQERETRPLAVLEAASRERQMVLLGDPGGGKSTFLNYVALCLAGARLEQAGEPGNLPGDGWLAKLEPAWTHGPLLPLHVTLRRFARSAWCDGTADGLWSYICEVLDGRGMGGLAPHLRELLLEGGVLVLLDGLDEVSDPDQRETVRNAVADFAATHNHPANRYLVTCRVYAYLDPCCQLDRFPVHRLAPLEPEQSDAFIESWYRKVCRLRWKDEHEAAELTRRLQEAIRRADLAVLARNPLQLTMMTSLHYSRGRLPDDRVDLYKEMVELLLVRWQEGRLGESGGVIRALSYGDLESALERVAFVAHQAQGGKEGTAEISEGVLLSVLKDYLGGSWNRAKELADYIRERAALLLERGTGLYTFPHRSYQEYLAGSYLAVQPDFPDQMAALVRESYTQWREVALWAASVAARSKKMPHIAVDVAAALRPDDLPADPVSDIDWRLAGLCGEVLVEAGLSYVAGQPRHRLVLARSREWLAHLAEQGALSPIERSQFADVLGQLGDPRPGVGLRPDGLPDIAWSDPIPAGEFIMGDTKRTDEMAFDDEKPRHTEMIAASYRISRYPVTNGQFEAFVRDGGYTEKWQRCWTNEGWEWKRDRAGPDKEGGVFDLPNHPVVRVSWYEAWAFSQWLSEAVGEPVSLPTEAQWERAARGTDGRRYPWDGDITPDHANFALNVWTTTAVGIFPKGASPCGALDMSGNVWEWCLTKWRGSYREPEDYAPKGDDLRVLRGGSFLSDAGVVRCAVRYRRYPFFRYRYFGFRVVSTMTQGSGYSGLWDSEALQSGRWEICRRDAETNVNPPREASQEPQAPCGR